MSCYRLFKVACDFAPIITLAVGATIAYELNTHGDKKSIRVVGPINGGLTDCFHIPSLPPGVAQKLFPTCIAVAFLAYIESISVACRFAATRGYRVDASQELGALGMANGE